MCSMLLRIRDSYMHARLAGRQIASLHPMMRMRMHSCARLMQYGVLPGTVLSPRLTFRHPRVHRIALRCQMLTPKLTG